MSPVRSSAAATCGFATVRSEYVLPIPGVMPSSTKLRLTLALAAASLQAGRGQGQEHRHEWRDLGMRDLAEADHGHGPDVTGERDGEPRPDGSAVDGRDDGHRQVLHAQEQFVELAQRDRILGGRALWFASGLQTCAPVVGQALVRRWSGVGQALVRRWSGRGDGQRGLGWGLGEVARWLWGRAMGRVRTVAGVGHGQDAWACLGAIPEEGEVAAGREGLAVPGQDHRAQIRPLCVRVTTMRGLLGRAASGTERARSGPQRGNGLRGRVDARWNPSMSPRPVPLVCNAEPRPRPNASGARPCPFSCPCPMLLLLVLLMS